MRVPLYTRLERRTHRLLSEYARLSDQTLNDVVEGLVLQLLFQVSREFEPPQALSEAVETGALPIRRCSHVVDEEPHHAHEGKGNLIRLGR